MPRGSRRSSLIGIFGGKNKLTKDVPDSGSEHGVIPEDATALYGYGDAAPTPKEPQQESSGRRGSLLGMFGAGKAKTTTGYDEKKTASEEDGAVPKDTAAFYGYGDAAPTVQASREDVASENKSSGSGGGLRRMFGGKKSGEPELKSADENGFFDSVVALNPGAGAAYDYADESPEALSSTEQLYLNKRKKLRARRMSMTPMEQRKERAIEKRNKLLLLKMMTEEASEETDLIQQRLGVDEKGHCLRHPNQVVCGKVEQHRFSTIHTCRICGSEQKAGGARQRKSMVMVIDALKTMQQDKKQWREKTKIMHHGKTDRDDEISVDDDMDGSKKSLDSFDEVLAFCKDIDEGEEGPIEDAEWKDLVNLRVAQVRAWDAKAALRCNPVYAKFLRMLNLGIPMEAVQQACEMDGWDYRVLDLDPNRPLNDQLASSNIMTEPEKDDLLWNIAFAMGKDNDETQGSAAGISETVALVHEAYCKKKGVLDNHRKAEKKRQDSQKWIGHGKELLKKPTPKAAPQAQQVYRHEYEEGTTEEVAEKVSEEVALPNAEAIALQCIGEETDEDMDDENDKMGLAVDLMDESTIQRSLSVHSILTIDSDLSNGSGKKKKKKRKSKLKTGSKRRSSKLTAVTAASATSDMVIAHRLLTEKEIVMSSLIAQVENLQRQVSEKSKERSGPQNEAGLLAELESTKRKVAEKEIIESSLVAQVQSLQLQLQENNAILEAKSREVPNLQSQLQAKAKVIEAQGRVIDALRNSMNKDPSTSSTVASTGSVNENLEVPLQLKVEHVKDDTTEAMRAMEGVENGATSIIATHKEVPSSKVPTNNDVISELRAHLTLQTAARNDSDVHLHEQAAIVNLASPLPEQEEISEVVAAEVKDLNPVVSTEDMLESPSEVGDTIEVPKLSKKKRRSSRHLTGGSKKMGTSPKSSPTTSEKIQNATTGSDSTNTPSQELLEVDTPGSTKAKRNKRATVPALPNKPRQNQVGNSTLPAVSEKDMAKVDIQVVKKSRSKKRESGKDKKKTGKVKTKRGKGKSKKNKSKEKREENLDRAHLRQVFKATVRKLVAINLSFDEKLGNEMSREISADRKSMRRSSMRIDSWVAPAEWNDFFSDDEEDLDEVAPLGPPLSPLSPSPGVTRQSFDSGMSLIATPRKTRARKTTSLILSPKALSNRKTQKSIRWGGDEKICTIKYVDEYPESLKKNLYYTADELKYFRFEKFMEDNGEEFEIIEESESEEEFEEYEEEYEDEEYSVVEEMEEESYYDEEEVVSATSYIVEEEVVTDDEFSEEEIMPAGRSRRRSMW